MESNYELTKEFIIDHNGVKLFRIQAIKSFSIVKAGELGGYVESLYLPNGELRIQDNAILTGDAWVSGNAIISGNARVCGYAWVFGNDRIIC